MKKRKLIKKVTDSDVLTFKEAIKDSKVAKTRHLLLGNGFSIACSGVFNYKSLFENADFSSVQKLPELFKVQGTEDFEQIMGILDDAIKVLKIYNKNSLDAVKIESDIEALKDILIKTITKKHPDHSEINGFELCKKFLKHFRGSANGGGNVYTLNYDLLLYWALRNDRTSKIIRLPHDDGFRNGKGDPVIWRNRSSANIHYLHGALHLFYNRSELHKYTRKDGSSLLEQVLDAILSGNFPLFVMEGESKQKLSKIRRNGYLLNSFNSFSRTMQQEEDALFIFGHSLNKSDNHILNCIINGTIPRVYVDLFGDPDSDDYKTKKKLAKKLEASRKSLKVKFFQSETAKVWG